jgi:hypothetical protein
MRIGREISAPGKGEEGGAVEKTKTGVGVSSFIIVEFRDSAAVRLPQKLDGGVDHSMEVPGLQVTLIYAASSGKAAPPRCFIPYFML